MLLAVGCSRGPTDAVIAAQIKARFFSDPIVKVSNVSVTVSHGEVTLGGTVTGVNVELQALKLAMGAEGVRKLNDRISVALPPEQPRPVAQAQPQEPRSRKALTSAAPKQAEPAPEQSTQDQAATASVGTGKAPGPAPAPVRVAILAPRPVLVRAPTEPEPGYAVPVPVPVPVVVNAPAEVRKPEPEQPVVLLAAGPRNLDALFDIWGRKLARSNASIRIQYQAAGAPDPLVSRADLGVFLLPISDETLSRALRLQLLHFPAAVWGVVPICNIGGSVQTLNFSGEALADVFSGKIANWDHLALRTLNPQVFMPAVPINVFHRSDASDETWLFTDYLSAMSSVWRASIGGSPSVKWPVGLGGAGNEGVANMVKKTPNSIGYVDASFALQNGLKWSAVLNRAGRFVRATPNSLAAAAAPLEKATLRDFNVSILDTAGLDAYPIASFVWIGAPARIPDLKKKDAVRSFLEWMLAQGQADAAALGFGRLPRVLLGAEQMQVRRSF